jgi:hypothetical protein
MSHSSTIISPRSVSRIGERRARLFCYGIIPFALIYCLGSGVLSRTAWSASLQRGDLVLGSICDVFVGGAVPGVLVTLLLGLARPDVFSRPVRQAMVFVSLLGAAIVAALPVAVVWLTR